MSLLKPTAKTPFHIDFDWWEKNDRDWRVFLRTLLCAEHQQMLADVPEDARIDWIDPRTAEVRQVDGIQNALINHCAVQPDFLGEHTTIVEGVFRVMLVNGNKPMSATELGKKLGRPPETILRTLAGPQVYRGLRPLAGGGAEESSRAVSVAEPP
jgi:hypothetical protein